MELGDVTEVVTDWKIQFPDGGYTLNQAFLHRFSLEACVFLKESIHT